MPDRKKKNKAKNQKRSQLIQAYQDKYHPPALGYGNLYLPMWNEDEFDNDKNQKPKE